MAPHSSSDLGVPRTAAWVPTHDTGRTRGPDPGTLFSAGRQWTPFGFVAVGHSVSVNLSTGGLVVSVNDLAIPYQGLSLQVSRLLDVQEQHAQQSFLDRHPNTDPRFHFFANWQLQTETQATATWHHAFPELLVSDGDGESALCYREYADFDVNETDAASVDGRLRSDGVPGRTLAALTWQFTPFDSLLRTRRGGFAILTGRFQGETMVDPVDLRLWRFEPITGMAYRYTSEFAYQQFVDADGLREVTVPSVWTQAVDPLGHSLTFRPAEPTPPHRAYLITDGSGRSFRLELDDFVAYLDGNNPGGKVKSYVVSRAIDQTRAGQNVVEYHYDDQRLVEVHYPSQAGGPARVLKYEYDTDGHLVGIIDPVGDSFTFGYAEDLLDSDERLAPRLKVTRIADNEGNSITYRYDHPHGQVVVTFTGADGNARSTTFTYDEDVNDTRQRFLTSQTTQVTRGYSGDQTVTTSQTYSDDGRYLLMQSTDPLGKEYRFEYNAFNQTTAITDPAGHRRDLTYDVRLAPIPTDPNRYDLIKSSEQNIDVDGNIFSVESSASFRNFDADSSDDAGDLTQSTHRVATRTDELGNVATYDYDDAGNASPLRPTTVTDPLGKKTLRTYDATGGLLSETDATGNTWRWQYNARGQTVLATDANGFKRYWVYDAGTGWLTDATDALGKGPGDPTRSVHYDWNDAGQRLSEKDAVSAVTKYGYFRNKRLRSITRYDPVARAITIDYDASGTVTTVTDPLGHQTLFHLDEAGRLYETVRDDPKNPAIRFIMDAAGRVTQLTNRNGQTFQYGYDALGRMTSIQEPSWPAAAPINPGKAVTIKYDFLGHRLEVTDSQLPSASLYRYDAAGNQRNCTDPFGFALKYEYNGRSDLVRVYDGAGVTDLQFGRDDAGLLATVTDSNQFDPSRQFRYVRSDGGFVDNLYRIELDASGIATRFQYDPNRQLTQIAHLASGLALSTFGYSYRADGLIGTAAGDHQAVYDYNGLKQVVSETDAGVQDGYDGAGNRLWRAALPVPAGKQNVYDADNRLLACPIDGTTFMYDADGNRLSRSQGGATVKYTYDAGNHLMRVEDGVRTIDYLYDVDGRLLQRIVTAAKGSASIERFRHASCGIIAIVDPKGQVKSLFTRDDEGRLLRRRDSAKLQPAPSTDPYSLFYLHDGLRSVSRVVDWDGKDFLRVDYDAWGRGSATGKLAGAEPFRYRSGLQDFDTGLINFGARWYDPVFGRWLTQDPLMGHLRWYDSDLGRWVSQGPLLMRLIAGSVEPVSMVTEVLNLYTYVGNDPVNVTDVTGLGIFDDLRAWVLTKYLRPVVIARDRAKSDPAKQQQTKIDQADETAKKAKRPANQPEGKRSKEQQQSSGSDKFVGDAALAGAGAAAGVAASVAIWELAKDAGWIVFLLAF